MADQHPGCEFDVGESQIHQLLRSVFRGTAAAAGAD